MVIVEATCGAAGKKAPRCNRCMTINQDAAEEIPATNMHSWLISEEAMPATCTAAGKKAVNKCSVCGLERGGESIPALGHDWGEAIIIVDAT